MVLLKTPKGATGVVLIGLLVLVSLAADRISPHDPLFQELRGRLTPPGHGNAGELGSYLLGTDALGRDVLSRLIYGARISLIVGITAVLISGTVGTTLGLPSTTEWEDEFACLAPPVGGFVLTPRRRQSQAFAPAPAGEGRKEAERPQAAGET